MKPTGPTNPVLKKFIAEIRSRGYRENIPFLLKIAEELSRARRRKVAVNLAKLQRTCREGESVVIPGKVLAYGTIDKKLTVAAWAFSKAAEKKLKGAGCKLFKLPEFIEKNPKGSNVRIVV